MSLRRQLQIVGDVSHRIPGLEEAGALNRHQRPCTAEHEPGRDADRLPLARDANRRELRCGERRFPRAEVAIGDPDEMGEAGSLQSGHHASGVDH